uniref:Uncharacterized protein n=1 Tax=Amphimedon queenslandica TaxID=400682 RepID=A0A1X7SEM8_AMPQE
GGTSVHDLEKAKKKLEQELEEINLMMERTKGQLEVEQNTVLCLQLEIPQLKQRGNSLRKIMK